MSWRNQSPGPVRLLIYFSLLSSVNLSLAGMQRLFWGEKYLSATVCRRYVQGGFCPRNKICPRTARNYKFTSLCYLTVNLSQAGMQRLFRGEKYLSGLYADGTFRKDFLPRNKICARTGQIYRLWMVSG